MFAARFWLSTQCRPPRPRYGPRLVTSLLMLLATSLPLGAVALEQHEWNYFLAASDPVVFQYSTKIRVMTDGESHGQYAGSGSVLRAGLYLAYSQTTLWDLWAWDESTPMIESSYRPEAFWRFVPETGPLAWIDAGGIHESNGLGGARIADSRAWNRLMISGGLPLAGRALVLVPRLWCILTDEGNGRIGKYAGYGELELALDLPLGGSRLVGSMRLRKGWSSALDHGSIQINLAWQPWAAPEAGGFPFAFVVQAFSGYGDTMIAYDKKEHHMRAGLAMFFD
ncbi:MAG TPA: phospholipase A [Spirochaetota bacterium]|nr:phospholipase A [Spirochaetota bacterium]